MTNDGRPPRHLRAVDDLAATERALREALATASHDYRARLTRDLALTQALARLGELDSAARLLSETQAELAAYHGQVTETLTEALTEAPTASVGDSGPRRGRRFLPDLGKAAAAVAAVGLLTVAALRLPSEPPSHGQLLADGGPLVTAPLPRPADAPMTGAPADVMAALAEARSLLEDAADMAVGESVAAEQQEATLQRVEQLLASLASAAGSVPDAEVLTEQLEALRGALADAPDTATDDDAPADEDAAERAPAELPAEGPGLEEGPREPALP